MTRRFVRMIDLVDSPRVLAEYESAHAPGHVPAPVLASQRRRGVTELDIYRAGDRLVMVMEVGDDFDPAGLDADAASDPQIAAWHRWMATLQKPLDGAEGWVDMRPVFRQGDHP